MQFILVFTLQEWLHRNVSVSEVLQTLCPWIKGKPHSVLACNQSSCGWMGSSFADATMWAHLFFLLFLMERRKSKAFWRITGYEFVSQVSLCWQVCVTATASRRYLHLQLSSPTVPVSPVRLWGPLRICPVRLPSAWVSSGGPPALPPAAVEKSVNHLSIQNSRHTLQWQCIVLFNSSVVGLCCMCSSSVLSSFICPVPVSTAVPWNSIEWNRTLSTILWVCMYVSSYV